MGSGSGSPDIPEPQQGRVAGGTPSASGRHRRNAVADTGWTPAIPPDNAPTTNHARPMVAPVAAEPAWPPPRNPLIDTGPVGLHSFNLGTIPASVTPPRSWRRAAWFAIFSSAAALGGLLFVTSTLIGPVHPAGRIAALPSLPSEQPLATDSDSGQRRRSGTPASGQPKRAPGLAAASVTNLDRISPLGSGGTVADRSGHGEVGTPVPGIPGIDGSATLTVTVTTVSGGAPMVDAKTLASRTNQFFSEVATNAAAAADLTAGAVRDDAQSIIEQRYGDLAGVQVQSISLDPSSGVTVSLLRVIGKDGVRGTERHTLQFTLDPDPKIENPGG